VSSALISRRPARFIVVSDQEARSANHDRDSSTPPRLSWRVIAANNRPLGRSTATYGDYVECVAATNELRTHAADLKTSLTFEHATATWRWSAELNGTLVAASVRDYLRRVECLRAANQFVEIAASAPAVVDEIRYPSSVAR
jgi:hypothetical protein